MSSPDHQFIIIDDSGNRITIEDIFNRHGMEEKRIIANDELGEISIYR